MSWHQKLFARLNEAEVRYVVVGGVAVILHGHARLTKDVDLVLDLRPEQARRAMGVLARMGYAPWAPVDPAGFADPGIRERWIAERNMVVFSLVEQGQPLHVLDLFVEEPMPFAELWSRARIVMLGGVPVRIAGLGDLIAMKREAGRPQDLQDIEILERIARMQQETHRDEGE